MSVGGDGMALLAAAAGSLPWSAALPGVAGDPALHLALRAALAAMMASAAFHKASDLARFREVFAGYRVLPRRVALATAGAVPLVEGLLAVGVALPVSRLLAATAAAGIAALMLLYAAALGANVVRGRRDMDCGCTGPANRVPVGLPLVLRNVLLAAAALLLVPPPAPRELGAVDALTVACATLVLACTWNAAHRLLASAPAASRLRERVGRATKASGGLVA